jgi:hypothetical protein
MNRASIPEAFRFLVEDHAFAIADENGQVRYRSESLLITPSYSDRDGFETHLMFLKRGTENIAIGTILAALGIYESHEVDVQVAFLSQTLEKLRANPEVLYDDLSQLRFWHAKRWRREWGGGITLSAEDIAIEEARLARLAQEFQAPQAAVESQH